METNCWKNAGFIVVVCCVLLFAPQVFAQNNFHAVLLNNADSTRIPYATIDVIETGQQAITDDAGAFGFTFGDTLKDITLKITAIGCSASMHYPLPVKDTQRVYVTVTPGVLSDVAVVGQSTMSAEKVVKKAIAAIPDLFADTDYYAYSSYRQYQKVNLFFLNLIEAKPVVGFHLESKKKNTKSDETFGVRYYRRSETETNPAMEKDEAANIHLLMKENPVYHLHESSLSPSRLKDYEFNFDTSVKSGPYYVIYYVNHNYTTERHGIENYDPKIFFGEGWEIGKLTIEKGTFAFRKIVRIALRNTDYSYMGKPNYVANSSYFMELVKGELVAEYEPYKGKMYLKKLFHQYTNDFLRTETEHKDFTITNVYEWYADSVTQNAARFNLANFSDKMVPTTYKYDEAYWKTARFPFYFYNKDKVMVDIELNGEAEHQFYREGILRSRN